MATVTTRSNAEKIFDSANYLFLILFSFTFILPLLMVVMTSITAESEVMREGFKLWPSKFSLDAYHFIFSPDTLILRAAATSVLSTVVGTVLNVMVTCMIAYGFSVETLPLKKPLMAYVLITMFFSGGLIPTYLVYKELHLINSFWVLVLPALLSPFNMLLVRNYFMSIPKSLKESARLDGAKELFVFFRIMLPLSTPILATIGLFSAVAIWNDWTTPMFFSNGSKLINLQYLLQRMMVRMADIIGLTGSGIKVEEQMPSQTVKMAVVVVATVPIIMLYPFLQKYFISGIMVGSVKE